MRERQRARKQEGEGRGESAQVQRTAVRNGSRFRAPCQCTEYALSCGRQNQRLWQESTRDAPIERVGHLGSCRSAFASKNSGFAESQPFDSVTTPRAGQLGAAWAPEGLDLCPLNMLRHEQRRFVMRDAFPVRCASRVCRFPNYSKHQKQARLGDESTEM